MLAFQFPAAYGIPQIQCNAYAPVNRLIPTLVNSVNYQGRSTAPRLMKTIDVGKLEEQLFHQNHIARTLASVTVQNMWLIKAEFSYLELCARIHNRLMHSLNGNIDSILAQIGESNLVGRYGSYVELVSAVPPVPQGIINAVTRTSHPDRQEWLTMDFNVAQMITALVLIELSPAGRAWGVKLTDVPKGTTTTDNKYVEGYVADSPVGRAVACVEFFFVRSWLNHNAPMNHVNWRAKTSYAGVMFACNAVQRMLYATQAMSANFDLGAPKRIEDLEARIAALELKLSTQVEEQMDALESKRNARASTCTCLMRLFEGQPFSIPPFTDRMCTLPQDARFWLTKQLEERTIWVRAMDPESEDNYISWKKFEGAQQMDGNVTFSYGNFRFYAA